MAEVSSGRMTVICLDGAEVEALASLLEVADWEDNPDLFELMGALGVRNLV